MQKPYLAIIALATRAAGYEVACPSCTTTTVTVVPPCVPFECTGSTFTETHCTQTDYTAVSTITREPTTLNAVNPGCPYTPRATVMLGCPGLQPCVVSVCSTVDTVTIGYTITVGDLVTITPAPLDCSPTGPGIPSPTPTTSDTTIDTTIIPPPVLTLDPDPCETGGCE